MTGKEFANLPREITSGIFSLKIIRCRRGRNSINKVAAVYSHGGHGGGHLAVVRLAQQDELRLRQQRATWAARWVRGGVEDLGWVGRERGRGQHWDWEKVEKRKTFAVSSPSYVWCSLLQTNNGFLN